MYSQQIKAEDIISGYCTKYANLDYLIPYAYGGSNANQLNVYIDLYGIYKTLLARHTQIIIGDQTSIATNIINICAHYRNYFKYFGVYTKFFLISSFNIPQFNRSVFPDYNKTMLEKINIKSTKKILDLNINLLELICPYLPDIFFIKTEVESAITMNYIMNIENQNIHSLIISSDIYPTQLCANRINTSMIYPKKHWGEDTSDIICSKIHPEHKNSFWRVIGQKSSKSVIFNNLYIVDTSNYALLATLNSMKDRDIGVLYNISNAINSIISIPGIDKNKITPDILFDMNLKIVDQKDVIINRYKIIDLSYQSLIYQESVEAKCLHYENLVNPSAIQSINDKYFKNNPIDIYRL